jgi:hypothetical protein
MSLLGPSASLLLEVGDRGSRPTHVSKHAKERAKQRGLTREQLLYGSGKNRTVIQKGGTIVTAYANNTKRVGCQIENDLPLDVATFTKTIVCTTSAHVGHIIGKQGTTIQYLQSLLTWSKGLQWIHISPTDNRFVIETSSQDETDCMASILETYLRLRDSYSADTRPCPISLRTHLKLMSTEWISDRDLSDIATRYSVAFFHNRTKLYCLLSAKPDCFEKVAAEIEIVNQSSY